MDLQTPVKQASRTYKMYASRLEKLGIEKLEDFLYHIPFRYQDYSLISKIEKAQAGEVITIKGKVISAKNNYLKKFKKVQKVIISDETGEIELTWFNQPYLLNSIKEGVEVSVSGRIEKFGNKKSMTSPDYEILTEGIKNIHTGRIIPIYPETKGVTSKWLRRHVFELLEKNKVTEDFLPKEIVLKNNFMNLDEAIKKIHFPSSLEEVEKAKKRLAFNEVFVTQLNSLLRRKEWKENVKTTPFNINRFKTKLNKVIKELPFQLTIGQKKAVEEILNDLKKDTAMNRLLEGDVGSGKTVVAAIAMFAAHLNGFQSVLMAPTEILAGQHFKSIKEILSPFNVNIALKTASTAKGQKGMPEDIIIGTHSVIYKDTSFSKLGLVVIDEQHRFGVEQRALLRKKGKNPHLLTMTATPIPRTIALTMYGDLDVSYLDELPKGRKKIKTWLVPSKKRNSAYAWIEKEIKENLSQAFIICPFIEESESMSTVKAATKEFETLKKEIFPNLKLGLLHGKLKGKEKDEILEKFKDKEFDILVATPVVEVGIDIPNATIIVIEASERFGLAQLHQLRGRVGRGEKQSYCLLFTESLLDKTTIRLKSMETVNSGTELAEIDLKLRGPGQIFGTMQHGRKVFKIADFSDYSIIKKAREEAELMVEKLDNHLLLKEKIQKGNISSINPD